MSDGARCHYCRKVPCKCPEPKPMSAPLPEDRLKQIAERCELWKSNPSLWQEERQLAARKDIPDLLQEIQRLKAELALAHDRVSLLEDAILEASVHICECSSADDKAAMRVFGKVMEEAAMKRLGI